MKSRGSGLTAEWCTAPARSTRTSRSVRRATWAPIAYRLSGTSCVDDSGLADARTPDAGGADQAVGDQPGDDLGDRLWCQAGGLDHCRALERAGSAPHRHHQCLVVVAQEADVGSDASHLTTLLRNAVAKFFR